MKIYIGISPNSNYFSCENIQNYLDYLSSVNKDDVTDVAFLIGDSPYVITYSVLKNVSITFAMEIMDRIGSSKQKCIEKVLKKKVYNFNVKIIRYKELVNRPFYKKLYNKVVKLYDTNSEFRNDIREQVLHNLKIREELNSDKLKLLDLYVLDEIAGLLTMSEDLEYTIEIYPKEDLFILQYIMKGKYNLLKRYKREFWQLEFE